MCCPPPCLLAGYVTYRIKIDRPLPHTAACVNCGTTNEVGFYRDDQYLAICFVPLCKMEEGGMYLACNKCGFKLSGEIQRTCTGCETSFPSGYKHCPECGVENEGRVTRN